MKSAIYLCKTYSGGTFWSSNICSKHNALIERTVSVPDGIPFEQQVQIGKQVKNNANIIMNQPVRQVENNGQNENKRNYCNSISQQILNLDAQARLPLSSQEQQNIREERKSLRDIQYRSHC